MIISKEQRDQLLEAAKPLMKFLADNFNPHTKVIVENNLAELFSGSASVGTNEFIGD